MTCRAGFGLGIALGSEAECTRPMEGGAMSFDTRQFRWSLGQFATGVAVITAMTGRARAVLTLAWREGETPHTYIVLIGQELDQAILKRALEAAIATTAGANIETV